MSFKIHDLSSAPERSQPILRGVSEKYKFIPNLYGVFAEAPAAIASYLAVAEQFESTSLSAVERNVVLLATSRANECRYCVGVHSTVAGMQGVPVDVVEAIRTDRPIEDPKLQALRRFTESVVATRGWPDAEIVSAFRATGYGNAQVLEVLVGVTLKTLSNYTNHIAEPPLDAAFAGRAWEPPPR